MKTKAIALISGGLDSLLAARVIMDQGIEVSGITFVMTAASTDAEKAGEQIQLAAKDAGVETRVIDISEEFLHIVRSPRHGYGKNANPCIDCKIIMLKKALDIMKKEKAGFIITGEVLGERPMSQNRRSLDLIRDASGAAGYLLRPLSAKLLPETEPEKQGTVDREKLLEISGRSRKPQLELARRYGLKKYSAPGSSCLLTDPGFSRKVADLLEHNALGMEEMDLLKIGRHFRFDGRTKAVVGRNEKENSALREAKGDKDVILRLAKGAGPDVLLRGDTGQDNITKAAGLAVWHSKKRGENGVEVSVWKGKRDRQNITAGRIDKEQLEEMRI